LFQGRPRSIDPEAVKREDPRLVLDAMIELLVPGARETSRLQADPMDIGDGAKTSMGEICGLYGRWPIPFRMQICLYQRPGFSWMPFCCGRIRKGLVTRRLDIQWPRSSFNG
jgi:hypothetical protein